MIFQIAESGEQGGVNRRQQGTAQMVSPGFHCYSHPATSGTNVRAGKIRTDESFLVPKTLLQCACNMHSFCVLYRVRRF